MIRHPISNSCRRSRPRDLCVVAMLAVAGATHAAAQEPSTDPIGEFELHEIVILVSDAYRDTANAADLFASTLPIFVRDERSSAEREERNRPMPLGVIRVFGGNSQQLDVLVSVADGRFLGHWPRVEGRKKRILWEGIELTGDPTRLRPLPKNHWFKQLRLGEASYLSVGSRRERFLLYDVELKFGPSIQLLPNDADSIGIKNQRKTAVHDLEIYRPSGEGWRAAYTPHVPAKSESSNSDEESATTTEPTITSRPADTQPAAELAPARVAFGERSTNDSVELLSGWRSRLTDLGLTADEVDSVVSILAVHALDENWLTAVYRLDPAELDELLPLEVVPQPRKTVRVGLVILLNADPMIEERIEELVAELGDREWPRRQAAETQLAELGQAALPLLKKALDDSDLEIVFRAERLIEAIGSRHEK